MVRPFSFPHAAHGAVRRTNMTKRVPRNFRYDSPARMVATFAADVARIEDFVEVFNGFEFDGVDDVEVETSVEFNTDALTEGADEDVRYSALIEKIGEVLGVEVSDAQEDDLRDLLSGIADDVAAVIRGRLDEVGLERSRAGYVSVKATAGSIAEGLSGALQRALDTARKEAREVEKNAIRIHNERVREANAKVLPMPAPVAAPQPAPVAAPVPAPQPEPAPAPKAKARKPKAAPVAPPVAAPAAPAAPVAAPAAPVEADLEPVLAAIRAATDDNEAVQIAFPHARALARHLGIMVKGGSLEKAQAVVAALRG